LILVFGGGGQLGRELRGEAEAVGVPLRALGHAEADIADPAAVERAIAAVSPSLVVNAAAYNAVDAAETEAAAAMRANAEGPGVLAEAAARHGVPLVHVSSDYVFDGEKGGPYVEDDAVAPLNTYGRSKLEGEETVRRATPSHYILRSAWLYSVHGANFVKRMVELAGERPELRAAFDQTGSPTMAASAPTTWLAPARRPATSGSAPSSPPRRRSRARTLRCTPFPPAPSHRRPSARTTRPLTARNSRRPSASGRARGKMG
jgi:dTDP-4-dehydrorhamnose reductase